MNLSVIFPIYGMWHQVNTRLWELFQFCNTHLDTLEVVLVDDFSNDREVTKGLNFWVRNGTFPKLIDYVSEENKGFGQSCNKGAELATGDVVIFHSTDVRISGDYLSQIIEKISQYPRSLVGGRLLNYDTGWNTFNGKIFNYLEGWMLACTKEVWEELGGFDPDFGICDYEDISLSTLAVSKGIPLIPLNSPYLEHIGGLTIYAKFGVEGRRLMTEKNREVFRQRWVKI